MNPGEQPVAHPGTQPPAGVAVVLERTAERLQQHQLTLGVAESLTGGLIGAWLTERPGASAYFRGAVVCYATDVKEQVLGVPGELLAARGAVDPAVARAMAAGARRVLGATHGVAVTGAAGPSAQDGIAPGTVYLAVCGPAGLCHTDTLSIRGTRAAVRTGAVRRALELVEDAVAAMSAVELHRLAGGVGDDIDSREQT